MLDRDQELPIFSEFLEGLSDVTQPVGDVFGENVLLVTDVKVNLPFELDIKINEDGNVSFLAAPPTQRIETTIMPVFHTVGIHLVLDEQASDSVFKNSKQEKIVVNEGR